MMKGDCCGDWISTEARELAKKREGRIWERQEERHDRCQPGPAGEERVGRKEQRRKRITSIGLAAFSALALLLAGAAVWQWNLAEEKS